MKGISAVIAVILLLLVTISIVGLAFGFFGRVLGTGTSETEKGAANVAGQAAQVVLVEGASGTSVSLRNIGTATLDTATFSFYVGSASVPGTCAAASLAPNRVTTCTLNSACSAGSVLKVFTAGGLADTARCS